MFGPHEADKWLIPSLIRSISNDTHMNLTPGEQKLAYLYVGECAKAIEMAIYADNKSGVYNICSDNPTSLKELVTNIRDRINPDFKLNLVPFLTDMVNVCTWRGIQQSYEITYTT